MSWWQPRPPLAAARDPQGPAVCWACLEPVRPLEPGQGRRPRYFCEVCRDTGAVDVW